MLKLKLQYFGPLMPGADSLEKTLMLGKTEGRKIRCNRGWDGWMSSLTQWTWVWESSGRWSRIGKPGVLQSMRSQRVGLTEWLNNNAFDKLLLGWRETPILGSWLAPKIYKKKSYIQYKRESAVVDVNVFFLERAFVRSCQRGKCGRGEMF